MACSDRLSELACEWRVHVDRTVETGTSLIAFGSRHDQRVVLKLAITPGDEWHGGTVAAAFDGNGMVRIYETAPGAALMEELRPGTSLVDVVDAGKDDEATRSLASVIRAMRRSTPPIEGHVTAHDWGKGFARHLATGNKLIPISMVESAQQLYAELCATQSSVRLLHGDLQHYNVLYDEKRGWTAIDPKGVVAEVELEVGAALRNPHGRPDLITTEAVERRIGIFAAELRLDHARITAWAHALAVLSAIWTVEDEGALNADNPALLLAESTRP